MSDVKWTRQHQQAWHRNKILVYHVAQVGNRMVKILRKNIGEVFVYCYEADPVKGWVRSEDVNAPDKKVFDDDKPHWWAYLSTVKEEKAKAEVWLKGASA